MWKRKICFALIIIAFFSFGFYIAHIEKINEFVINIQSKAERNVEYRSMHEMKVNIENMTPLEDEEDAFYTKYHFIMHSGGSIDGRTYTNSLEAWENSYALGNRIIDADMRFTTDGELVLLHAWNDNLEQTESSMDESDMYVTEFGDIRYIINSVSMDYKTFMNKKIFYKYTPMDCTMMINFMKEHNDLYVACDMKGNVADAYSYLVNKAYEMHAQEILDRIIVSIYKYEDYEMILNIHEFENVMMRQYSSGNNYYELAEFCINNDIHAVSISQSYINDEGVRLLQEKGIHIYVAVVDYISTMKKYYSLGADGAVTSYLQEDDWQYIQ